MLLLTVGGIHISTAQVKFKNQYAIGFNYNPEWQVRGEESGDLHHIFGFSGEAQFSEHSGLELFVGHRQYSRGFIGIDPKDFRFTSVRLAYKFYSNAINAKAGLMYDLGWGGNYWDSDLLGAYLSVSKDITLGKNLIFEPEIRYTFAADANLKLTGSTRSKVRDFLGAGLKLKYRF
jgi:hypothetical protein